MSVVGYGSVVLWKPFQSVVLNIVSPSSSMLVVVSARAKWWQCTALLASSSSWACFCSKGVDVPFKAMTRWSTVVELRRCSCSFLALESIKSLVVAKTSTLANGADESEREREERRKGAKNCRCCISRI